MKPIIWLILSLALTVQAQTTITYQVTGEQFSFEQGIEATLNGQTTLIVPPSGCFSLIDQRDYDGNGFNDALVANLEACGGNTVGNTHFFVFYDGQTFGRTEAFGYTWAEPVVEVWENNFAVYTKATNAGGNLENEVTLEERHILQGGEAVQIWSRQSSYIPALAEVRAKDFENDLYGSQGFAYDLDADGQKEFVECSLWERWGEVNCAVNFSSRRLELPSCKRIGVLASMTNGVHDLVCGAETIMRWHEGEYLSN
jgi:hypothetical protein